MRGLSEREVKIISWLEFYKKYFFTSAEIDKLTKDKAERYRVIGALIRKKRIIKLNKTKYYLIPIKAKSGSWSEHPFVIVDEIMNGKDYVIGGWAAANYWKLTDQIPMQTDVYSTQKQGKMNVLHTRIVFHRARPSKIEKGVMKKIQKHHFIILSKKETKKWLKSRE